MAQTSLDEADRRLLDIVQTDFPIAPRPYAILGEKTGMSEGEAFARIERLRGSGVIRRLGANFQSGKLGYVSTLCAASVPAEKLDHFIKVVNAWPEVTHNYERDHPYNIWFTLISSSREKSSEILEAITAETGVEILNLPAKKMFKIRVNFPMAD